MDYLWDAKSEDAGLIVRAISFQGFSTYVVMIHQRHRQTDKRTDRLHATAIPRTIVHCAVKITEQDHLHQRGPRPKRIDFGYSNFLTVQIKQVKIIFEARS